MSRDIVADYLSHLTNVRVRGLSKTAFSPVSKLIIRITELLKREGYVKRYRLIDTSRGKVIEVELSDIFNKAGAIKPRFPVNYEEIEKYEKRFLPALNFGKLIISTHEGLITNDEAKQKKVGGTLIAFVY
jgi:small subunit ribosomal protein S8